MTRLSLSTDPDIHLGGGYFFRFHATTPLPNEQQPAEHWPGWELAHGTLRHKQIDALLPGCDVAFFPVFETSVQMASLIQNVFASPQSASFLECDSLLIDWPESMTPLLAQVQRSYPQCVVVTDKTMAAKGIYLGQGLGLTSQLESQPVVLLESLEPRRLLLNRLHSLAHRSDKDNPGTFPEMRLFGGVENILQWTLNPVVRQAYRECPAELLLTGGLLPFFQARLASAHVLNSVMPAWPNDVSWERGFIKALAMAPPRRIRIAAGLTTLARLDALLTHRFEHAKLLFEEVPANGGVIDLSEIRKTRQTPAHVVCQLSDSASAEVSRLPGFLARDFVSADSALRVPDALSFTRVSFAAAFSRAAARYADWTRLEISKAQERNYYRFAHRLALESGSLFPTSFDLLLAAQAVMDANFAFELVSECRAYPVNPDAATTLPTLDIPLQELFSRLAHLSIQRFDTLQRHKQSQKLRLQKISSSDKPPKAPSDPVSEEKYADNTWVYDDHPYSCSFPDEDLFMEEFAFHYRKQAAEMIRSRESVVREMESSIADGLDIRATLRNWHLDKIMVREDLNIGRADVGSIVFNFAQPGDEGRFSWKSFWLAEHHDNSNLMFYATPFQDSLIGPGIAKSEFGGFAVIPLPSDIANPWGDAFLRSFCKTPAEACLLAGALATSHRSVLYIAAHPPAKHISDLLKRSGKFIIYFRLDELPPDKVRRVRTFHILAEAGVRDFAQKYIRKDFD